MIKMMRKRDLKNRQSSENAAANRYIEKKYRHHFFNRFADFYFQVFCITDIRLWMRLAQDIFQAIPEKSYLRSNRIMYGR